MKKLLSLILALLLIFSFAACGSTPAEQPKAPLASSETVASSSEAAPPAPKPVEEKSQAPPPEASEPEVSSSESSEPAKQAEKEPEQQLDKDGSYTTKEDVALYIHLYGKLPSNFITKKQAEKLGWSGGGLEKYAPGKCIGGNRFGNYEGLLPKKDGRSYTECDIDTLGAKSRGAKRIVFSNDGLVYYTDDHYKSFELLYGKE